MLRGSEFPSDSELRQARRRTRIEASSSHPHPGGVVRGRNEFQHLLEKWYKILDGHDSSVLLWSSQGADVLFQFLDQVLICFLYVRGNIVG